MRLFNLARLLGRAERGKWILIQSIYVLIFSLILIGNAFIQDRITALETEAQLEGASVFVITVPDGLISTSECLNLTTLPTVQKAGYLGEPYHQKVSSLRTGTVPTVSFGGDLLNILNPTTSPHTTGYFAGAELAHVHRLARTSIIRAGENDVMVGDVVDVKTRAPEMNGWLFHSDLTVENAASCWVEFANGGTADSRETVRSAFSSTDVLTIRQLAEPAQDRIPPEFYTAQRALTPLGFTAASFVIAVSLLFENRGRLLLWSLGINRSTHLQLMALRTGMDHSWNLGGAFLITALVLGLNHIPLPSSAIANLLPIISFILVARLVLALRIPKNLVESLRK